MVLFDSGHLQNECERPDMEWKYMNIDKAQWKEPDSTNLLSEVVGGTNIQSMQAHVLHLCSVEHPTPVSEQWDCYVTVAIIFQ